MPLRKVVVAALRRHGIEPAERDTPAGLREHLNDLYLDEVRRLKAEQLSGAIPLREYAGHVQALKDRFALLGLPLEAWIE